MTLRHSRTWKCDGTGRPNNAPISFRRTMAFILVVNLVLTGIFALTPARSAYAQGYIRDTDLADSLLGLINAEREKESLPALVINEDLSGIAALHAADMIESHFFGHVSPNNGTLAARVHKAGIFPVKFAENLAGHTSVTEAHKLLMGSSAHKGNIVSGDFDEVGIAVLHGGPYGLMIVEVFASSATPEVTQAGTE